MSAQTDDLKKKVEKGADEAQKTATDTADEAKVKAEEEMKKVIPGKESGKSG